MLHRLCWAISWKLICIQQPQSLASGRRIWLEERLLPKSSDPRSVSGIVTAIVPAGIVNRNAAVIIGQNVFSMWYHVDILSHSPIVPKSRRPRRPLEAHLDVHILLVDVVQVVENHITLGLVQADNAVRHGAVDPKRFPASGWVDAHEGVHTLN